MKMLKTFIIFLFFTSGCIKEEVADVQKNAFIKMFGKAQFTEGIKVFQKTDGSFIFLASTSGDENTGYDIVLAGADVYGNETWYKTLQDSLRQNANDMLMLPDGGYLILGTTQVKLSNSQIVSNVYLIRTDNKGNINWKKTIGDSLNISSSCFLLDKSKLFIVGSVTSGINESELAFITYDTLISKSKIKIFKEKYQNIRSLAVYNEEYLLFGSNSKETSTSDLFFGITISSINFWPLGDSLGGKTLNYGKVVKKLDDGSFICLSTSTNSNADFCLIKFKVEDESIIPMWTKFYGTNNNDDATGLVISNAKFAMCGTTGNSDGSTDILFIETDAEGNEINRKILGGQGNQRANNLCETSDGSYVIIGSNETTGTSAALLLKLKR